MGTSRRSFLRSAALSSAGLALLAACGPPAAPAGGPAQTAPTTAAKPPAAPAAATTAPKPAEAAAGTPKKGGTLRVGLIVDAATMDPHLSGSKVDRQIYHNLYDPLVILDDKLGIQPNLVESWQNPDPKTLVLKLRSGVKFHDGTDLNAEAVKVNFDRMAGGEPKSVRKGEVANVASTDAVDPLTVRLNLKQPDSTLLAALTDRAGMMISPTALKKLGPDLERNASGAGTGPFEFVEWIKDDHLLLKRNENYWNKEAPFLDQIRYRPLPDDTVKLQSLQAGEIDVMDYLAPRNVALAKGDSSLVVVDVPSLAAFWYMLNTTKPPFDNKALRQAVMYAIDNEAIVKGVWLGVGVPSNGPISPSSWAYDDTIKPIKRDLDKAKAKLAEGGKPSGFTFDFNLDNTPLGVQEAEVVKAQLAEAGITMNVNIVDGARLLAEGNNKTFQASSYAWSGRPDPDGNTYQFFHTTPGTSLNWSGFSNTQADELLEQTRVVSDHAERKKLYSQFIGILREEAPVVFIIHPIEPKAFSPKVQGYPAIPDGMMRFRNVWLK